MKKALSILALIVLFNSCKKSEDDKKTTPVATETFTINGITDLSSYSSLDLTIAQKTGAKQEDVNLELSGLPTGVTGFFSSPKGIPTFNSKLSFKIFNAKAGTYPIKLSGKSASYTKDYNFNLSIPEQYNGIYVDNGEIFDLHQVQNQINSGSSRINIVSYSNGGIELDIDLPLGSPSTPGTYSYNVSDVVGPGTAVIYVSGAKYYISKPENTEKVTFTIASPDYPGQNKITSIDLQPISITTLSEDGKLYIKYK